MNCFVFYFDFSACFFGLFFFEIFYFLFRSFLFNSILSTQILLSNQFVFESIHLPTTNKLDIYTYIYNAILTWHVVGVDE